MNGSWLWFSVLSKIFFSICFKDVKYSTLAGYVAQSICLTNTKPWDWSQAYKTKQKNNFLEQNSSLLFIFLLCQRLNVAQTCARCLLCHWVTSLAPEQNSKSPGCLHPSSRGATPSGLFIQQSCIRIQNADGAHALPAGGTGLNHSPVWSPKHDPWLSPMVKTNQIL